MAENNNSNRCPTVDELHDLLKDLKEWEIFGISLRHMKYSDIEEIKEDERKTENRKLKLYAKWLKVYPDASWEDVICALKKADEWKLVKLVQEKYKIKMDTGFYSLRSQYHMSIQWKMNFITQIQFHKLDKIHCCIQVYHNQNLAATVNNAFIAVEAEVRDSIV